MAANVPCYLGMAEAAIKGVEATTIPPKVSSGIDSVTILCVVLSLPILLLICSKAGITDFVGFLVGAKLLGTRHLYDVAVNLATQSSVVGSSWQLQDVIFVRPPFFALAVKPLLWLSFSHAVLTWRLMLTGALLASAWLLPGVPRQWKAVALSCSVPAYACVAFGGDAPFILLLLAVSMVFWIRGDGVLAGVMLALCLGKFHYLIFLPLLLMRARFRRPLIGFLGATGALVSVNFLLQPDWVHLYWQGLHMPQANLNSRPDVMPNLYASFYWTGHQEIFIVLGAFLVMGLLWRICEECSFEVGVACCVLGALVVAPHTNALDAILSIPALLTAAYNSARLKIVVAILLSPFAGYFFCACPAWGPLLFVAVAICILVWYASQQGSFAASSH